MAEKVYEMTKHYRRGTARLLEMIEKRDEFAALVKIVPPEMRAEGHRILADLNCNIDSTEAALVAEYEAFQILCRSQETLDAILGERMIETEKFFIRAKHTMPRDEFKALEAQIARDHAPELVASFYTRVAIREATQLERILGETDEK